MDYCLFLIFLQYFILKYDYSFLKFTKRLFYSVFFYNKFQLQNKDYILLYSIGFLYQSGKKVRWECKLEFWVPSNADLGAINLGSDPKNHWE